MHYVVCSTVPYDVFSLDTFAITDQYQYTFGHSLSVSFEKKNAHSSILIVFLYHYKHQSSLMQKAQRSCAIRGIYIFFITELYFAKYVQQIHITIIHYYCMTFFYMYCICIHKCTLPDVTYLLRYVSRSRYLLHIMRVKMPYPKACQCIVSAYLAHYCNNNASNLIRLYVTLKWPPRKHFHHYYLLLYYAHSSILFICKSELKNIRLDFL